MENNDDPAPAVEAAAAAVQEEESVQQQHQQPPMAVDEDRPEGGGEELAQVQEDDDANQEMEQEGLGPLDDTLEDLFSNSSENGLDNSDVDEDQMFDEYIVARERLQSTAAEIYNTELPTEHAYLGKLERVEGVDYLEPGKIYRLPICRHNSIVFPGEVVPMIVNVATLNCNDPSGDGVKFGLIFSNVVDKHIYGVTCQVFERGDRDAASGSIVLKTVAQQRFRTVRALTGPRAEVLILPEIQLPDPLFSSCSNPMMRHAVTTSKESALRIRSFLSRGMVWPKFVYDQYGTDEVLAKVNRYLAFLKIDSVPSDPVKLSFWLARNIPIDEADRERIYKANAVITRMLIINKSLDHTCHFICKRCKATVGSYNDIFAMSKEGIQTSYCNPAGYVHETLTIYKTADSSTFTVDRPSTEFSWFPGYSWQITLCNNCRQHLGWKFVATKKNYLPKSFYGLSGGSISVKSAVPSEEDDDDDEERQQGRQGGQQQQQQQNRLSVANLLFSDTDENSTEEDEGDNEGPLTESLSSASGGEEGDEVFQDARE